MSAVSAGLNAGISAYRDPGSVGRAKSQAERAEEFDRAWAYYRGKSSEVYTAAYRAKCAAEGRTVYGHTRLVINPVPSIVDFYVDNVFTASPEVLEDKSVLVTPLSDGTEDELKAAVAQLEQWGNWLSAFPRLVRYGGVGGGVLVEVDDDFEREKVIERIVRPPWVKGKTLDATGNVKSYILEYKAWDAKSKEYYTYRKEVDAERIRYFRNDRPFDPPARSRPDDGYRYNDAEEPGRVERGVYEHDYGFCPAVYVKHDDDGDDDGTPAVPDKTKIDEANSLICHRHDHQHKAIEAGKAISTDGTIEPVTGAFAVTDRMGRPTGLISTYDTRTDWLLLKMKQGGSVHDLGSSFDLSKGDPDVVRLLESFERDFPELQAHEIIKNKAQIAGVALERMLAPAQRKLDRSAANYHQQLVKLRQMQIAISGMRYNGGGWTRRDEQQQKFAPFNLDSYSKGALNFGIKRSLLIQSTPLEEEELKGKRAVRAKTAEGIVDRREQLEIMDYSEEKIVEMLGREAGKPPEDEQ